MGPPRLDPTAQASDDRGMRDPFVRVSRYLTDTCLAVMRRDHPLPWYLRPVRLWTETAENVVATVCVLGAGECLLGLFALHTLTGTVLAAIGVTGAVFLLPLLIALELTMPDTLMRWIDGEPPCCAWVLHAARCNLAHHLALALATGLALLLLALCGGLALLGVLVV